MGACRFHMRYSTARIDWGIILVITLFEKRGAGDRRPRESKEERMKRSFVLFAIAMLALIGGAADAVAADNSPVLSRIVESGTFKVGMSGTQPPFSVISKSGSLIGYEVDLANILADAMGVKVEFVQKPFGELLSGPREGRDRRHHVGHDHDPQAQPQGGVRWALHRVGQVDPHQVCRPWRRSRRPRTLIAPPSPSPRSRARPARSSSRKVLEKTTLRCGR